jgi:hypothetical protein
VGSWNQQVFTLQQFEAKLHNLDDSCFSNAALASDCEKHLLVGLQSGLPTVSHRMGQDFPHSVTAMYLCT